MAALYVSYFVGILMSSKNFLSKNFDLEGRKALFDKTRFSCPYIRFNFI